MFTKSCDALVKAAGPEDGLAEGQFQAIVSAFGNIDSYGDVVMPGAFVDSIAEWEASGAPIPSYYSHRMDDPDFNIGWVLEAKEVPEGLWVDVQLDIADPAATSKAPQVYRLMKGRRLKQFSFAYDIIEAGWAQRKNAEGETEEYYELRKLAIHEVGPTPIGANNATELLAVKTATEHVVREVKAGRVLSAKDESSIRSVHSALTGVIEGLVPHDQEKASGSPADTDEDQGKSKAAAAEASADGKSGSPSSPTARSLAAATFDNYAAAYCGGEGA
ncbi:HK97 family phage prohead protease [Ornithinimicrobium sp. Arc0846-15]|nr:HK97 family phage prohead protease [Ornithinimicrobium laminariae]